MAGKRELEAVIRLSGITDPSLQRALRDAKKQIDQLGNSGVQALGKQMESFGKSTAKVGKTLTKSVTAPILAAGAAALKSAVDYESAFAGVRKTVDATSQEYEALSDSIRAMAVEIPASADEIAGVMEIAGQLGIKKGSLLSFTRAMIDLGEATNLSATEGAEQLAKFANITGMSQKDFGRLGSAIVELGNNSATTEADIVAMATRLAGAGSQIGLSEAQILGFSAALSSVGIEAEAGGSAFSKIMVGMQLAVETGKDGLEDFARVAGMTTKEFQAEFARDAAGAIQAFIVGLSKMDEQGISAIRTLDDMGISEVRLRDTLLRATNANELFARSQELAGNAWGKNSALAREAETRYATTASQLAMLKNSGMEVLRQLGEALLPYAKKAMTYLRDASKWLAKLSPQEKDMAVKLAGIAAAAGPVLTIFGKFIAGTGKLMQSGSGLLSLLGRVGGTVGAVGLAGAALWGVYQAWKAIDDAATSTRLAARFGDAKVSAEELQAALDRLNTPLKGKISEFMQQSEALEEAWGTVQATQQQIGELNFQIDAANANVKMTEAEKQALATALQSKVQELSGQVYGLMYDKWYKVNAAFDIVGAEFNASGMGSIQTDLQAFYRETQQEAATVAADLNRMISSDSFKAMSAEEQNAIVNAKVAEYNKILSRISMGAAEQSKNVFDAMLWKAANGQYSPEEAGALRKQLLEANAGAIADADKAEATALAEITNLHKQGFVSPEGTDYGNVAVYEKMMRDASAEFDNARAVLRAQAESVPALIEANQLRAAFRDELGAMANNENWGMGAIWDQALKDTNANITSLEGVEAALTYATGLMGEQQAQARMYLTENKEYISALDGLLAKNDAAGGNLYDDETLKNLQDARKAFSDLEAYTKLNPGDLVGDIMQAQQAGASLPEGVSEGIDANAQLAIAASAAMAASTVDAMDTGLGYNSPSTYGIAAGQSLPQGVAIGIMGMYHLVHTAMAGLVQIVRDYLTTIASMRVTLPSISGADGGGKSGGGSGGGVKKMALGGTVYGPTSALLGEAGYPETVVPHTATARSRELALEALRGTGMRFAGGAAPTFAPNITVKVQGGGDPGSITEALRAMFPEMYAEFERWWEEKQRTETRESFA